MPSPSGPRWAWTALMARRSAPSTGGPVRSTIPAMPHMARQPSLRLLPLMGVKDVSGGLAGGGPMAVHQEPKRAAAEVVVSPGRRVHDVGIERVGALVEKQGTHRQAEDGLIHRRRDLDRVWIGDDAAQIVTVKIVEGDAEDDPRNRSRRRVGDVDD